MQKMAYTNRQILTFKALFFWAEMASFDSGADFPVMMVFVRVEIVLMNILLSVIPLEILNCIGQIIKSLKIHQNSFFGH